MKGSRVASVALALALGGATAVPVAAEAQGCGPGCMRRPYGDYCRGSRWGRYGAKEPVTSADDARRRLEEYYAGENVVVGGIIDRKLYFEAEISDSNAKPLDVVIIDKRSGRIRSIL